MARITRAGRLAIAATLATGTLVPAGWALMDSGEVKAGNVSAATAKKAERPCSLARYSKYRKFVGTKKTWPNDPVHRIAGYSGQRLDISKKVGVKNSVTATFGVTIKAISNTVGFSVEKSWEDTMTASSGKLPYGPKKKKLHYQLQMGRVYKAYKFNVYERRGKVRFFTPTAVRCVWDQKPDHWVGTGTAYKFWIFDSRVRQV
ncbi:hypothetical protein SMC26_42605 [Actinomadura fulvescens]|uniref:Tat pathway signal sequence domain protein n=1 Tax=Actinomadura fulvescens TaxID=46160 RepID=A0ABN3QM61_9ACTN